MRKHSIPDARGHIPALVEQVAAHGETVVFTLHDKTVGALLSLEDFARYRRMEEFDCLVCAAADDADPNRVLIPMKDALAELRRLREQRSAS